MQENGVAHIKSPIEEIKINRDNVKHLVEENEKARVGFLNYEVRTMENPNLIVSNGKKNSYIKLFFVNDLIKPHLQIVKVTSDGSFYVTNYRPTKNQVYNEIIKGQVVYDLSSLRNDSVLSFVNSTISQSKADVKYEQAVYEGVDLKIYFNDPELERLYNIQQTTNLGKNLYEEDFNKWVEDKITKDVIAEIVSSLDYIVFGTKNKIQKDTFIYVKNMKDGSTIFVEEVRTKRKTLSADTM